MQPKNMLVFALTYLGLLPFVACTALGLLGYTSLPVIGSVSAVFIQYAFIIVSFMAGTHWGIALSHYPQSILPFYSSISIAITVWLFASYAGFTLSCIALSFLFLLCLWVDRFFLNKTMISLMYFRVRVQVTMVVVTSLFTMGVISIWH